MRQQSLITGLLITLLASTTLLTGCATTGATALNNESQNTIGNKIIVGKTTQSQIEAMYGKPQNIKQSSTGQTYVYVLSASRTGNILHGIDNQDLAAAAQTGGYGLIMGDTKMAVLGAAAGILGTRTGQASNKSDETVQKSLIVKFNKQGVVSSYTLN